MSKLDLKFISVKDDAYYFKMLDPKKFLKKHEYAEGAESYYPFFKGKDSDDYILKVKSKYVEEEAINKEEEFVAIVSLKDFKMQGRDKKLKYGYYVNVFDVVV